MSIDTNPMLQSKKYKLFCLVRVSIYQECLKYNMPLYITTGRWVTWLIQALVHNTFAPINIFLHVVRMHGSQIKVYM